MLPAAGLVCIIAVGGAFWSHNTLSQLNAVDRSRDGWQRTPAALAALALHPGATVADLGCGPGYFSLKLASIVGPSGHVLAVDLRYRPLAALWLRALLDNDHNLRLIVGDPDNPNLPAGAVDAVLVAKTYHEFERPGVILGHIARALRPGGRLVLLDRSAPPSGDANQASHVVPPANAAAQLGASQFEILSRDDHFVERPNGERWWLIVARPAQRTGFPSPSI